jgi:hypothetical protein
MSFPEYAGMRGLATARQRLQVPPARRVLLSELLVLACGRVVSARIR